MVYYNQDSFDFNSSYLFVTSNIIPYIFVKFTRLTDASIFPILYRYAHNFMIDYTNSVHMHRHSKLKHRCTMLTLLPVPNTFFLFDRRKLVKSFFMFVDYSTLKVNTYVYPTAKTKY